MSYTHFRSFSPNKRKKKSVQRIQFTMSFVLKWTEYNLQCNLFENGILEQICL